ncbi:hypothetical protein ACIBVL_00675 [Streptomyces sp. NPDC049687]|uniref:hypothetical protein n=1 Tax=Streptomyces sp. NPDC049687 TaxID=3365596 RepID=UPI0037B11917
MGLVFDRWSAERTWTEVEKSIEACGCGDGRPCADPRLSRRHRMLRRFCRPSALHGGGVDMSPKLLSVLGADHGHIGTAEVMDIVRGAWGAGRGYMSTAAGDAAISWALRHIALSGVTDGCPCGGTYDEQAASILAVGIAEDVLSGAGTQTTMALEKRTVGAAPEASYVHDVWVAQLFGSLYYLGYSSRSTAPIWAAWEVWLSHRRQKHGQPQLEGFLGLPGSDDLDERTVVDGVADCLRSMATRLIDGTVVARGDLDVHDMRDLMRVRSGLNVHGAGFGCRTEVSVAAQMSAQTQEVFDSRYLDGYNTGWYRYYDTPQGVDRLCNRLWTLGATAPGGLSVLTTFVYGMCDPRHSLVGRLPSPADPGAVCDWPLARETETLLRCDPAPITTTDCPPVPDSAADYARDMLEALCAEPDSPHPVVLLKRWERMLRMAFKIDARSVASVALPMLAAMVRVFRYVLVLSGERHRARRLSAQTPFGRRAGGADAF